MKFRLVELLRCVRCDGALAVTVQDSRERPAAADPRFVCRERCARTGDALTGSAEACAACAGTEIVVGTLACRTCRAAYPVVGGVPWLFDEAPGDDARTAATVQVYSHLWNRLSPATEEGPNHLDPMEQALKAPVITGTIGIEAGSGTGADTVCIACRHSDVELISLDLSEGVYQTYKRAEGLPNVHVVRGSVLAVPVRTALCDFAYSFGVLHHTIDPDRGLRELARVLKPKGRLSLYLYEAHENNPWKRWPLKLVTAFRQITTKLPTPVLSGLCWLLSPLVVLVFSWPARAMSRFRATRALADQMPFNFGTSPFSIHGDLLDRLGVPIEVRYSRQGVVELLRQGGLTEIETTKLDATAGWAVQSVKPTA